MRVLRGYHHNLIDKCALTVGTFEALHCGHQMVIAQTITKAKSMNIASAILTFEPLPNEFFADQEDYLRRIYRFSQRLQIIRALNPNFLICLRFDKTLAAMSADDFISRILVDSFNVKHISVGENFYFGRNREGDFDTLKQSGKKSDFSVECIDLIKMDDEAISTTRVREVLLQGDFELCRRLLGRYYEVVGTVVEGDGNGRALGFATANIHCGRHNPPLQGVFTANIYLDGVSYSAVVNAGVRPTVNGKKYQLEAHLLDFSENIYGRKLRLRPLVKLRDEKRFKSLELLKQAVSDDINNAKRFFDTR